MSTRKLVSIHPRPEDIHDSLLDHHHVIHVGLGGNCLKDSGRQVDSRTSCRVGNSAPVAKIVIIKKSILEIMLNIVWHRDKMMQDR